MTKNNIIYKLIPAGKEIFSIHNQAVFILKDDAIVKITNTCMGQENSVFAKPMQLLFNIPGHIPYLIEKGTDEWALNIEGCETYKIPPPQFMEYTYNN